MRLFAFQGLRYTARAGDAGRLAAPPYDQIDDTARDRLHAVSPYQFAHLTRPVGSAGTGAGSGDPYRHAAELHRHWLHDGIIARDRELALYPYVIDLAGGGQRLGVMALVGYAPPSEIRPHEQTIDKPLADRLALLEATRVDLEPALLLAEDDGQLDRLLAEDLEGRPEGAVRRQPQQPRQHWQHWQHWQQSPPLVDYLDDAANHHLLYRIVDPARIAEYQEALAARPAAIADGHHRYKVGQQFAAAHHTGHAGHAGHASDVTAAAAKLSVVTSMSSHALTIDPIHRALRQAIDPARLAAALGGAIVPFQGASGGELARAVAAAPQPALGVWVSGQRPEIWLLGAASAPAPLVVKVFQDAVLPALGLAAESATDGTLAYRSDPDVLYAQVERGELGTGFWLPPMRPADFSAAIAHGELLPPKSTRFLPKAMSGLVWSDHESQVSGIGEGRSAAVGARTAI
jgi:uncharacterized protein (DUF1015 family)